MDIINDIIILVLTGMVFSFAVSFIVGFIRFHKKEVAQQISDSTVKLRIEVIDQPNGELYLLYELPNNNFVLQGNTTEELTKKIVDRFKDKNVFLIIPNGLTIPLVMTKIGDV